jgi:sigma-B regulation protein RsbU (phosphoserine phosphatase)
MDGLTLLTKLKELNRPVLRAIIVSAYGDMENIRTAMNRGAFDFLTKPIDFKDLEITMWKTIKDLNVLKSALKTREELSILKHELSLATEIQNTILRQMRHYFQDERRFEIAAKMTAAKDVGGDFYDAFHIDEEHVGVVIGDVQGKGISAALLMAVSVTMIRAVSKNTLAPAQVLEEVNIMLLRDITPDRFVTVFYGILSAKTGEFTYCSAGHNLPYLIKADGSILELVRTEGSVLGMLDEISFDDTTIQRIHCKSFLPKRGWRRR